MMYPARVRALLLVTSSCLVMTTSVAVPARADVTSATGRAFGVSVTNYSGTGFVNQNAPPQPTVAFLSPPAPPSPITSTGNVTVPPTGSRVGELEHASGVVVSTAKVGTLGTHTGGSHSSADLQDAYYLADELVAGYVHSECEATGAGASGDTTFGSMFFVEAPGIFRSFGPYHPAPNTSVTLYGGNGTVVFNEQKPLDDIATGTTGIEVNAIHITRGSGEVIIGHSRCTATGPDVVVSPLPGPHTTLLVTASPTGGPAPLTVTYTYKEYNDGTVPLSSVSVADIDGCGAAPTFVGGDNKPGGTVGILDPGEVWTYTCTHVYTTDGSYVTTVKAFGTDTITGGDVVEQVETTVEVTPAPPCDLSITKTMSPTPLVSGQPAKVTITVTNLGTGPCNSSNPSSGAVGTSLDDLKPAGLTFTGLPVTNPTWDCGVYIPTNGAHCLYFQSIPSQSSFTFTINATVTGPPGSTVTNCATITNPNDTNLANNKSCVTKDVVAPPQCDLSIDKTMSPNPLVNGQPMTITITVKNVGKLPCSSHTIMKDSSPPGLTLVKPPPPPPPPGWNCFPGLTCLPNAALLPNSVATFTINGFVTAPPGSKVTNCATIFNGSDTNLANNKSCVSEDVAPSPKCDLAIDKTMSPNPLVNGQPMTITITVKNVGKQPCGHFTTMKDLTPPGLVLVKPPPPPIPPGWVCFPGVSCTGSATLLPNSTTTFTINGVVTAAPGSTVMNCAMVSNPSDINPANNTSCVSSKVVVPPPHCDLRVTKIMSPTPLVSGQPVAITIIVDNVGTLPCTSPTGMSDPTPPGLILTAPNPSPPGWSCGHSVGCTLTVTLAPMTSATPIAITGVVTATKGTTVTNCASVSNPSDTNPANDTSCVTLPVT